jgi:hypothetical protein
VALQKALYSIQSDPPTMEDTAAPVSSSSSRKGLGRWTWAALLVLGLSLSVRAQTDAVTVVRPDGTSVALSAERLMGLPRAVFTASAHDKAQRFEGSDLRDVLAAAGVDQTAELRGNRLRRLVSVQASDGYVVVFALAELDASIGDKRVYLVNRAEGAALAPDEGPWRLVVPSDHRPARWSRQVARIVVADGP